MNSKSEENNIFKKYLFHATNISAITLGIFSVINFNQGNFSIAYVELGLTITLIISAVSMFMTKDDKISSVLAILVIIFLSFNNLISGGFKGTGIFWIFILPSVSYFVVKLKTATMINIGFIISILVISTAQLNKLVILPYSSLTLYLASISLSINTALTLVYKYTSDLNFRRLEKLLIEQELFNSILEFTVNSKGLRNFANDMVCKLVKHFDFDAGFIHVHSTGDDFVEMVGNCNISENIQIELQRFELSDPTYADLFSNLKPMYMIEYKNFDPIRYNYLRSETVFMLPLLNNNELVGVLTLISKNKKVISEESKELLEKLAIEVSLVLQHTREEDLIVESLS